MKTLIAIAVLALSACAQAPQQQDTVRNYTVNACLHSGECAGRPYPVHAREPWRASDEGLGVDSGTGL
jgi:hypothetical protein